jgi:cytochrome c-type protein NapC
MRHSACCAAAFGALLAATPALAGTPDWSKVPARKVIAFYPGVASLEWVLDPADHSGARGIRKGESCVSCHEGEGNEMGRKIVSGEKAEPSPPKDKAPGIAVMVQAAHDGSDLYLRFQWKPGPGETGVKQDEKNQAKLAIMIDADAVAYARIGGCWSTCHDDLRSMPDAAGEAKKHSRARELDFRDNGPTKYITESRTALELRSRPRGGWDRIQPEAELARLLQEGRFFQIMQFRSGAAPREGYVAAARYMRDAPGLAEGKLENGLWTVVFTRKLESNGPGSHALKPGRIYNFGFAVHDEYANERRHHVSFGYLLGIDTPGAEINALRQD